MAVFMGQMEAAPQSSAMDHIQRGKKSKISMFQGRKSQNFLRRICKIFVTLGLKILILLRFKKVFKADILKGWC